MLTQTPIQRNLVQPVGALWIVKGNQALVAETDQPLAAVQLWQGKQLFAKHGHKASSRESQSEPAMRADGLLSPWSHQLGQDWTELCWWGEDQDSPSSHDYTLWEGLTK